MCVLVCYGGLVAIAAAVVSHQPGHHVQQQQHTSMQHCLLRCTATVAVVLCLVGRSGRVSQGKPSLLAVTSAHLGAAVCYHRPSDHAVCLYQLLALQHFGHSPTYGTTQVYLERL